MLSAAGEVYLYYFYVEVSDRVEEVRWLCFKCIFPSRVLHAAHLFFSKMKFFKHELLCLNTADAVLGFSCVGPSKLMSLEGFEAQFVHGGYFTLMTDRKSVV